MFYNHPNLLRKTNLCINKTVSLIFCFNRNLSEFICAKGLVYFSFTWGRIDNTRKIISTISEKFRVKFLNLKSADPSYFPAYLL
jgi:hypothetical protein